MTYEAPVADLPMYRRPETAVAHAALWAGIRDRLRDSGIAAPDALSDDPDLWAVWQHPALLLGQTCSLPFRTCLAGTVRVLGAFDFGLPETPPGYYHSVFVARADDPRIAIGGSGTGLAAFAGARFACNEALSQSGWAAAFFAARDLGIALRPALFTGAHRLSAVAVARGRADLAALDAVAWRMLRKFEPDLTAALRSVGRTEPTPGLPLITARYRDPAPVSAAVAAAVAGLADAHRATLGLAGFVPLSERLYRALDVPPAA